MLDYQHDKKNQPLGLKVLIFCVVIHGVLAVKEKLPE